MIDSKEAKQALEDIRRSLPSGYNMLYSEPLQIINEALTELERLQRNLDSVEKTIRESFPEFMPLMTLIRTGKGLNDK